MTSPWQHIPSMRIISQNGVSDTPNYQCALLHNCRDNAKLACHCTACYKIEWIYMKTKVSGPDSLELALEMRKKERLRNGHFFEHLVLAYTFDLISPGNEKE